MIPQLCTSLIPGREAPSTMPCHSPWIWSCVLLFALIKKEKNFRRLTSKRDDCLVKNIFFTDLRKVLKTHSNTNLLPAENSGSLGVECKLNKRHQSGCGQTFLLSLPVSAETVKGAKCTTYLFMTWLPKGLCICFLIYFQARSLRWWK